MTTLSLDTSTELLCLAAEHGDSWATLCVQRGLKHSPALLPLAERLLADIGARAPDLELVVCSLGPGSFTGIRIGLATALGIGHGLGVPVVGASTLDSYALPWEAYTGDVFPVVDARKGRIYTALYGAGTRRGDYRDITPAELGTLLAAAREPLLVGPEAPRIRAMMGDAGRAASVSDAVDPRALLRLGKLRYTKEGAEVEALRPLYLRKSEAEIAIKQDASQP
jgi:tRNA threonylcarbamoyladenosine biosynthesis protein TsaB